MALDKTLRARSEQMKSTAMGEFEAWAASYDASPLHRFLFQPAYRMVLEEIYRWRKDDDRPFDALDIGCGTGTLPAMLATSSMPVRAVGLDYSPAMCTVGEGKARQAGLSDRLSFVTADSEHLPFTDGSFDVVSCSNSFHHYPHQEAVVKEVRRVLRPGGRFLLIDGFRDNVIGWVVFDMIVQAVEKEVFHASWPTIDGYFRRAGFQDIRRRKFGFWLPLLLTVGEA
jgi:ubiquinone/menaquinone biosynthesis C-methylase UbiE